MTPIRVSACVDQVQATSSSLFLQFACFAFKVRSPLPELCFISQVPSSPLVSDGSLSGKALGKMFPTISCLIRKSRFSPVLGTLLGGPQTCTLTQTLLWPSSPCSWASFPLPHSCLSWVQGQGLAPQPLSPTAPLRASQRVTEGQALTLVPFLPLPHSVTPHLFRTGTVAETDKQAPCPGLWPHPSRSPILSSPILSRLHLQPLVLGFFLSPSLDPA